MQLNQIFINLFSILAYIPTYIVVSFNLYLVNIDFFVCVKMKQQRYLPPILFLSHLSCAHLFFPLVDVLLLSLRFLMYL